MQNDFVDPTGNLSVASAAATVPAIARLRNLAHAPGMLVVYTQDWHSEDDPEFAMWGRHAVGGTWGAEIVPALAPGPRDLVVRKLRYDGFYGTALDVSATVKTATGSSFGFADPCEFLIGDCLLLLRVGAGLVAYCF